MKTNRLLLTAAAAAACGCTGGKPAPEKPNIISLMFDDLGYGDLGCYGQEKIETPNIDALAAQGILFTDMYSAAPLSAPSRCCIVTGKHMGHSQIRSNKEHFTPTDGRGWNSLYLDDTMEGQQPMLAGTPTIGKMMQEAGYKTAMVGKWGLGFPASDSTPNKMGFDYFYGFNCQALAHCYYPTQLWENGTKIATGNETVMQGEPLPEGLDPLDPASYDRYGGKYYSPDLMYDKLAKLVCDKAGGPFFLMWTTTVPHSAVQAPFDEIMHYVDKLGDEEPRTDGGMYLPSRYPHAAYAAMVTHIDTQVGKLVAKLKELGVWNNTVFIVTSDNGPAHNGNSPMEYFQSGGPFCCAAGWGKSSLHEGGIRMPFVVAWGDKLKGQKCGHMGFFADLMPTFADLAGVEAPENDGISFAPILRGKTAKQQEHEYLYWEFPGAQGWVAVRIGQWKGLLQRANKGNQTMELYDLQADPRESVDVAAEHPEIVQRMWEVVRNSHEESVLDFPKFKTNISFPDAVAAE
ncbi:MAG: arylsulfatase [Bacteroidales bacterium]|nr:arylsulfatase [Bacteroidales bacterium]